MKRITLGIITASAMVGTTQTNAAPVAFDLENDGAAGIALESAGTYTEAGVTINATPTGGVLNSNASSFGVNNAGADVSDQIDAAFGESLDLEFVFGGGLTVSIISLDFVSVGSANGGDAVFIAINNGATTKLETGVTGFNGSSDVYTPSTPIALSSGDVLTITAEEVAGIEGFTLEIVPEPSSLALLGLGGLLIARRRRA